MTMAKEFVGQEYVAATNGKGLHQHSQGMRILGRVTMTFSVLLTVLSVGVIAFCLVFAICPVYGTSMMTTFNATGEDTDSAITCYLGAPQRGDIVVSKLYLSETSEQTLLNDSRFAPSVYERYPNIDDKGRYMFVIKRLIATAGDVISMYRVDNEYYLYLNGEKLNEDYLDITAAPPSSKNLLQLWNILNEEPYANLSDWLSVPCDQCVSANIYTAANAGTPSALMLTIPADCYFLMGDNRNGVYLVDPATGKKFFCNQSWDSTYLGPIPQANYISRCVDIIENGINLPQYLWNKFVYYVCFGWAWQ
ncbi:MAG: signal peptidase I [Prevotella sp.]|nr:signal peptidase I [Prevotella sp.]